MLQTPTIEVSANEALQLANAALTAAECRSQPIAMSQALATVAHCYRRLRAPAATEAYLEMALRWGRAANATDQVVDLLCELCETTLTLAQTQDVGAWGSGQATRERARRHAFEASSLSAGVADAQWEVSVLLRISDALNRLGDHEDAAQLQSRALRRMASGMNGGGALLFAAPGGSVDH